MWIKRTRKSEKSREKVAEQETGKITGEGGGFTGNYNKEKEKKSCCEILEFPTEKWILINWNRRKRDWYGGWRKGGWGRGVTAGKDLGAQFILIFNSTRHIFIFENKIWQLILKSYLFLLKWAEKNCKTMSKELGCEEIQWPI